MTDPLPPQDPAPPATPVRGNERLLLIALVVAIVAALVLTVMFMNRLGVWTFPESDGDAGLAAAEASTDGPVGAPSIENLFTEGNCDYFDLGEFEKLDDQPLNDDPSPPGGWSRTSETTGHMGCEFMLGSSGDEGQTVANLQVAVFDDPASAGAALREGTPEQAPDDGTIRDLDAPDYSGVIIEYEHFGDDGMETDYDVIVRQTEVLAARDNIVVQVRMGLEVGEQDLEAGLEVLMDFVEQAYVMCGYHVVKE